MAYMAWTSALEVGHRQIDDDHRTLVEALNRLHAAMEQGKDQAEIEQVLVFLRDYAVSHFTTEEGLMLRHGYPGASAHLTTHADLVLRVSDFIADGRSGKVAPISEVLAFLEVWLVEHILGQDMELGGFLRNKGVEA